MTDASTVSAPEAVIDEIAAEIAPEGEPGDLESILQDVADDLPSEIVLEPADETPAEEPAEEAEEPAEEADDENPDGDEETPSEETPTTATGTSDPTRLRAAELLEAIIAVSAAPEEERPGRYEELVAEAALIVPMLMAPVSDCDACRGKVVSAVVHEDTCNLKTIPDQSQEVAEAALQAKVAVLPEEFRDTVLGVEMPKIAARYLCNCAAAKRTQSTRSSGNGSGTRGARQASKRMSAQVIAGEGGSATFKVSFPDDSVEESWALPVVTDVKDGANVYADDADAKKEIKRIKGEAEKFAVDNGCSVPGQKNAVGKGLTSKSYRVS